MYNIMERDEAIQKIKELSKELWDGGYKDGSAILVMTYALMEHGEERQATDLLLAKFTNISPLSKTFNQN